MNKKKQESSVGHRIVGFLNQINQEQFTKTLYLCPVLDGLPITLLESVMILNINYPQTQPATCVM